jgi:hypothetical protein
MRSLQKLIDSADKKAFITTLVLVSAFVLFIATSDTSKMFLNIKNIISKSHESSGNAHVYCANKENRSSAFCSDRKAVVNEKWKEVTSSGSKNKSSFSMSR